MNKNNYLVKEKQYCVTFHFNSKAEAQQFKLPTKYAAKFELNNNLDMDNHQYIRIAQIKA